MGQAAGPARDDADRRVISPTELAVRLGLPAPTAEQQRVIAAPLEPHVVVAGAGSGKTETMAARVVWLVANGFVVPDEVLGLTFTRKAAGELAERIGRRLRGLRAVGLLADDALATSPTIATYHSYAAALVRDHGLEVGVEPSTRLLGEAASWQLAHDVVDRWDPHQENLFDDSTRVGRQLAADDLGALERASDTIVQDVLSLAGQCAEHLVEPGDLADELLDLQTRISGLPRDARGGAPQGPAPSSEMGKVLRAVRARQSLVPVLRAYLRRKQELEVMDFGDQVVTAARLAETAQVVAGQRRQYRVVLLDEFQDTSHAQLELLARLFGGGHPVTAVGDPHQSIYGWRGASAGTLTTFRERFRRGRRRAPVLDLTTSWRNPASTLALANTLAQPLGADISRGAVRVRPLAAAAQAPAGEVALAWHSTVLNEADWVADEIAARWRPGQGAAVICRRRAQFLPIEAALRARGLPVEVVGLGGLLQRPEVADVVATLQVLSDPTRADALMRLLSGPRWQLGPRDLMAFGAWARELATNSPRAAGITGRAPDPDNLDHVSLVDALDTLPPAQWRSRTGQSLSSSARVRLARLAAELARLRPRVNLPLVDLVAEVERSLLLEIELAVQSDGAVGLGSVSGRHQLDAFADVAAEFGEGLERPGLAAFVAWLAVAAERERGLEQAEDVEPERPREGAGETVEESRSAVQVLTVHAAKGLEWDVVAVPGLMEKRFPAGRTKEGRDTASGWPSTIGDLPYTLRGDADALPQWDVRGPQHVKALETAWTEFKFEVGAHEATEERRLAYVALTRTRSHLLLSGYRWDTGRSGRLEPSRFLREAAEVAQADARMTVLGIDQFDQAVEGPKPLNVDPTRHAWPVSAPHERQLRIAAELVLADDQTRQPGDDPAAHGDPAVPHSAVLAGHAGELQPLVAEIDRLLDERAADRTTQTSVRLPEHLSASAAVQLASDPERFALGLRRPMPMEPKHSTRRGVEFHEWIERRLRSQSLLDLADLAGAGDDDLPIDSGLEALKVRFESSHWAQRQVLDTEIDVETVVGGTVFRGRLDAVFAAPAADAPVLLDIVDWKTGPRPRGDAAQAALVQLAVYRVALARLRGLPLAAVRASFFYVATGETITPRTSLDEDLLTGLFEQLPAADWRLAQHGSSEPESDDPSAQERYPEEPHPDDPGPIEPPPDDPAGLTAYPYLGDVADPIEAYLDDPHLAEPHRDEDPDSDLP